MRAVTFLIGAFASSIVSAVFVLVATPFYWPTTTPALLLLVGALVLSFGSLLRRFIAGAMAVAAIALSLLPPFLFPPSTVFIEQCAQREFDCVRVQTLTVEQETAHVIPYMDPIRVWFLTQVASYRPELTVVSPRVLQGEHFLVAPTEQRMFEFSGVGTNRDLRGKASIAGGIVRQLQIGIARPQPTDSRQAAASRPQVEVGYGAGWNDLFTVEWSTPRNHAVDGLFSMRLHGPPSHQDVLASIRRELLLRAFLDNRIGPEQLENLADAQGADLSLRLFALSVQAKRFQGSIYTPNLQLGLARLCSDLQQAERPPLLTAAQIRIIRTLSSRANLSREHWNSPSGVDRTMEAFCSFLAADMVREMRLSNRPLPADISQEMLVAAIGLSRLGTEARSMSDRDLFVRILTSFLNSGAEEDAEPWRVQFVELVRRDPFDHAALSSALDELPLSSAGRAALACEGVRTALAVPLDRVITDRFTRLSESNLAESEVSRLFLSALDDAFANDGRIAAECSYWNRTLGPFDQLTERIIQAQQRSRLSRGDIVRRFEPFLNLFAGTDSFETQQQNAARMVLFLAQGELADHLPLMLSRTPMTDEQASRYVRSDDVFTKFFIWMGYTGALEQPGQAADAARSSIDSLVSASRRFDSDPSTRALVYALQLTSTRRPDPGFATAFQHDIGGDPQWICDMWNDPETAAYLCRPHGPTAMDGL